MAIFIRTVICLILFFIFTVVYGLLILIGLFDMETWKNAYLVTLFCIWLFSLTLSVLTIYRVVKGGRRIALLWAVFLALNIACFATYHGRAYYISKLTVVGNDVYLDRYTPFANNNLARLSTRASLKFSPEDNLPVLDGSTALYPLYAAFAESVYPNKSAVLENSPDINFTSYLDELIRCSRTNGSYKALADGKVDLIFVPEPSEAQLAYAAEKGVELEFIPIGKEAFVFLVNAANPVSNLSTEELKDIYSGKITNWRQVRGKNNSIRAFQRNENSGSQTAFLRFMGDRQPIAPLQNEYISVMGGMIEETADYRNHRNALGYSFHFFVTSTENKKIKLLAIDGVMPDADNISKENYPQVWDFYAVRIKNNPNPNVEKLINWVLSAEGQELVEKTGYFRIK